MKITKSQLREIIREEIKSLSESMKKPGRGDIGYVEKHKSIATVYNVMDGGKKLQVKLGKSGKLITIDPSDIKILPDL